MRRILVVSGTRPEAVKLAPLVLALRRRFALRLCASGQHRDLLDPVFAEFGLRPDHDLDVMRPGQSLFELTAGVLDGLRTLLASERPDAIVVQGDTTTTFAGALAGFYAGVPVGHVEAGLRSGDPSQPFPEEVNRRLVGQLARWHFAPTPLAAANLVGEGVAGDRVFVTGNTVVDALEGLLPRLRGPVFEPVAEILRKTSGRRILLVTAHRRESFGAGLERICRALIDVVARRADVAVVLPLHPNPEAGAAIERSLAGHERIHLCTPLPYPSFLQLMQRSHLVLTDSGGVQEEAPSLGKPVLVMRDKTERPEGVEQGLARLVGTDGGRIVAEVERLFADRAAYEGMVATANPYGDGKAAERIAGILATALGE